MHFELTKNQQRDLQELEGRMMYSTLDKIMKSPAYRGMKDEEKDDIIAKVLTASRAVAKQTHVEGLVKQGKKLKPVAKNKTGESNNG